MNLFIQDLWGGSSGAAVEWKSKVNVNIGNYIYDRVVGESGALVCRELVQSKVMCL